MIQASSRSIRAVHRGQPEAAEAARGEAKAALDEAHAAVRPFPVVASAGFLHDAEKEYVEAVVVERLIDGGPLPSAADLGVGGPAWLNGLAEAASELRRHLLDLLRAGEHERAETTLGAMDDVYDLLVTIDHPDALTGGLRRTVDALRAVLERSRADLTTTAAQVRLQRAIDSRL